MDFKRKRIILIAGIILLIVVAASVIKLLPSKSIQSQQKVIQQENISDNSVPVTKSASANYNSATAGKPSAKKTIKSGSVMPDKLRDNVIVDEESQEGKAEREEAYKDDTPEKAQKRATLETEIRTLSEAKEKEEKELSTLISSLDEAYNNSQLPPEELQKKQAEIKTIKLLLMRTYSDKLSSIDSSLQEKLQQYRDVTTEKTEAPEIVEVD